MGSTPRQHRYQIPMPVRSTDIQMLGQCPGRWVLQLFYEKEQAEASFFALGSLLHEAIEDAILQDLDIAYMATTWIHDRLPRRPEGRAIESSQRGWDTIHDDYQRMIHNWFKFVHPDSDKRLDIYNEYQWPPEVEVSFKRGQAWGQVDAVFFRKDYIEETTPDPGQMMIVDWKSGTQPPKNFDQLDFYRYGLGKRDALAAYHMLDRVRKPSIFIEADEYPGDDAIESRIDEAVAHKQRLLDGELPEFNQDWWCGYCPVQEFCPEEGKDKKKNLRAFKRMLRLARPLNEIGE